MALQSNLALTRLRRDSARVGYVGVNWLAVVLQWLVALTTLDLSFDRSLDEGAKALALILESSATLATLSLRDSDIGNFEAAGVQLDGGGRNSGAGG